MPDKAAAATVFVQAAQVPPSTTGYLVVSTDWDPASHPCAAWSQRLFDDKDPKSRRPALQEARAEQRAYRAMDPQQKGARKVILRVDTTYTIVDDGGSDG